MNRFRVSLTTRGALLLVMVGVGFIFLWTIRPVLPPLVWALIVAYIFSPVIRWLVRRAHLPRLLAVFLLFAILVISLAWVAVTVRPVLMRESRALVRSVPRIVTDTQNYILGSGSIDILGVVVDPSGIRDQITTAVQDSMSTLGQRAIPFVMSALSSVVDVALFLVSTFYLLLDLDKAGPAIVNFLPRRWRREIIPLLQDMERVLGNYVRGQLLLIIIMTVASWIVLTVLHVRFSVLLAVVTGVVEIFPVIGPWTAGAIAIGVSLTQPTTLFGGNSLILAGAVGACYLVLRQAEDIFVIPNVVGRVMELHPLVILFSLTAGAYLAGILGVLIAVPVAAVVKIWLRFVHGKLIEEEQAYAAEKLTGSPQADPVAEDDDI
jgi:predicted PurR-regulated permease PerM